MSTTAEESVMASCNHFVNCRRFTSRVCNLVAQPDQTSFPPVEVVTPFRADSFLSGPELGFLGDACYLCLQER